MLIYSTGCMLENDGLSFSLLVGRFIILLYNSSYGKGDVKKFIDKMKKYSKGFITTNIISVCLPYDFEVLRYN